MAVSEEQSDWANLPNTIVDLIAEKLVPPLSQFIRFGAVCKPWRTTIMENPLLRSKILERCHRHVPLLMIPTKDKSQERRGLYNIIDKKTYDLELTVPYNRRCCGSSYGWIATLDRYFAIKLINPFTGGIIHLPSMEDCFYMYDVFGLVQKYYTYPFYVKKVILTDDPYVNPDNFMIISLYGGLQSIAVIRPGDKTWASTKCNPTYTKSNGKDFRKTDLIFHKGKCYAVDEGLGIVSVDVANTNSSSLGSVFHEKMVIPPIQNTDHPTGIQSYIVESSDGEILTVQRFYDPSLSNIHHHTVNFKVFKVQGDIDDEPMLAEVKNIGDDALFLGDNYSMSVAASRFPGCRSNSIYFTDDMDLSLSKGPTDMGIFSLETSCFKPYYELDPSHLDIPPLLFLFYITHPYLFN